jgi:cell division protein FtsX
MIGYDDLMSWLKRHFSQHLESLLDALWATFHLVSSLFVSTGLSGTSLRALVNLQIASLFTFDFLFRRV